MRIRGNDLANAGTTGSAGDKRKALKMRDK